MKGEKVIGYITAMARPKLPDNERLVVQALRISPEAKAVLEALPIIQKKQAIATVRKMAERIIISFNTQPLQAKKPA